MTAEELLDTGQLSEAMEELTRTLKSRPTDAHARVFLFELLCFSGDYQRAAKQLDVLETQATDPGAALAFQMYRALLAAERQRQLVFDGTALPKFLLTPPPSVEQYVLLLSKLARGESDLVTAYGDAEEITPAQAGRLGDKTFTHFRDADDRVAPVLEAFHGSDYIWLPFEQIDKLEISSPTRLRELMWIPAVVTLVDEPPGDVFIPALYVNSHHHSNNQVKLGRLTEWTAIGEQIVIGAGLRVFLADDAEHPVLDLRDIEFGRVGQEVGSA